MALVNNPSWLDEVEFKLDSQCMLNPLQRARDMVRRDTDRFITHAQNPDAYSTATTATVSAQAPEPADKQAIMDLISKEMARAMERTNERLVMQAIHGEKPAARTDASDSEARKAIEELSERIRELTVRADAQEKQIEELTEALKKTNPNYGRF